MFCWLQPLKTLCFVHDRCAVVNTVTEEKVLGSNLLLCMFSPCLCGFPPTVQKHAGYINWWFCSTPSLYTTFYFFYFYLEQRNKHVLYSNIKCPPHSPFLYKKKN